MRANQIARLELCAKNLDSLTSELQALINELHVVYGAPDSEQVSIRDRLIVANEFLAQGEFELLKAMERSEEVMEFVHALEQFVTQ